MKETTLYQVVSLERGTPFAPICCDKEDAYFGHGYYFWEHSIDVAHSYGRERYNGNNYIICESSYDAHSEKYLDLAGGCVKDIDMFRGFVERLKEELEEELTFAEILGAVRKIPEVKFDELFWAIKAKPIQKRYRDKKLDILVNKNKKPLLVSLANKVQVCVLNLDFLSNNREYKRVYPEDSCEPQSNLAETTILGLT